MDRVWTATPSALDFKSPTETGVYDNLLMAESMEYKLDLGLYGFNRARWIKLVTDYLDTRQTHDFLERAELINAGKVKGSAVAGMMTRYNVVEGGKHFFGNCITSFNYRGEGDGPILSMHSRTSYLPSLGLLDLALAHALARELGDAMRLPSDAFGFRWYVDSLQFPGVRAIPAICASEGFRHVVERVKVETPQEMFFTIKAARSAWQQVTRYYESGRDWREVKYGPMRAAVRFYEAWVNEKLKPLPVKSLTLKPLWRLGK